MKDGYAYWGEAIVYLDRTTSHWAYDRPVFAWRIISGIHSYPEDDIRPSTVLTALMDDRCTET